MLQSIFFNFYFFKEKTSKEALKVAQRISPSSAFSGFRVWKDEQSLNSTGLFSYDFVKTSILRTWGFIQVCNMSFPSPINTSQKSPLRT